MITAAQLVEAAQTFRALQSAPRLRDIVGLFYKLGITDEEEIIALCETLQKILPSNMIGILRYISSLHRMRAAYGIYVTERECQIAPIDVRSACFASTIGEEQ